MIFTILLLAVGLAMLVKFSSTTIKNAVNLSKLTGISEMVIGFMLIAVATSLPELSIAITSSVRNEGILSFGNLVGANIAILTLVFGVTAFIGFRLKRNEFPEIVDALILVIVISFFLLALGTADAAFGIFCIILFFMFSSIVEKRGIHIKNHHAGLKTVEIVRSVFYLLGSVALVIIGAYITTDSAIKIAEIFTLSEGVIGASILAIGTTLPELSVSVTAIRKKNIALAVGDAIGSIVTNLTLILGIALIINPIIFTGISITLFSLIFVSLLFMLVSSRIRFDKYTGTLLLAVYAIYLFVLFFA